MTAFNCKGLKAIHYHSKLDDSIRAEISVGNYQLLFTSPETLLRDRELRDYLECDCYQENLVCVYVCVCTCMCVCTMTVCVCV